MTNDQCPTSMSNAQREGGLSTGKKQKAKKQKAKVTFRPAKSIAAIVAPVDPLLSHLMNGAIGRRSAAKVQIGSCEQCIDYI